jgi:hypothetical protein
MLSQYRSRFTFLFPTGFLLVLAGLSLAQDASEPSMTPRERTQMAETFSTEKLCSWQKRLNLSDWKISVKVVRTTDLLPKTLGNIHWDGKKKTAVIRVLDPADYKMPLHAMLDDMEFTVVHELIHLELSPVLSSLHRDDANRMEEEGAVNHMAQALLDLERAK